MSKKDLSIVFMGTPDFAATCLKALVDDGRNVFLCVCQPDKPVGRKHIITPPPSKLYALEAGIKVFQPSTFKDGEAFEYISKLKPDLIVTAAYGKILPKCVLDIPQYGSINVHASLLPKYRGAAPVQHSILNGDKVTGVTIMKMDEGMDTGDILTSVEVPIDANIHTDELMSQLAIEGSKLLINMLDDYVDGKYTPIKQDESKVTVSPPIAPEQGIFNWNSCASSIHNKVRALSSWPGASTIFKGNKLKIYDSLIIKDFDESALTFTPKPGDIVFSSKSTIIVKCAQGYLQVLTLQEAGGKRLNASECAHNYKPGMSFGD